MIENSEDYPYTNYDNKDYYRYRIRSNLINACLEGGEIQGVRIKGYTGYNQYQYAQYLLTSIAKYAFNIHRRMGYEETIYLPDNPNFYSYEKELQTILSLTKQLSDEEFNKAVLDLQRAQKHVHYMLREGNLINADGTIPVYRTLNFIELAQIIDDIANGTLSNPDFTYTFQSNILLSGERECEHIYRGYAHRPLKVRFQIPAEDLILHPDYILTSYGKKRFANSLYYEEEVVFFK